jgi:hypothetical protein
MTRLWKTKNGQKELKPGEIDRDIKPTHHINKAGKERMGQPDNGN